MRSRLTGVLLAISLVACGGGDDPVSASDTLSAEESTALANILVFQGTLFVEDAAPALVPAASPARAPFSITEQLSANLPCPLGGSMGVSGSSTVTGDTESDDVLSVIASLVAVHMGCVETDEASGFQFTLTGEPNITYTVELMGDETTGLSVAGTAVGRVRWQTPDDRVGLCGIDLAFATSLNFVAGSLTFTTQGQVCDDDISVSETINFGDLFG